MTPLGAFSFVIGRWIVDSETFPEAYGNAARKSITVRVLVAAKPGGAGLIAFAVNTMSRAGIVYDGEVVAPGQVVFVGQIESKGQRIIVAPALTRTLDEAVN